AGNTGTHTGQLYSVGGSLLASAVFLETASGWQEVSFAEPVGISAGVTYVVSYHSSNGFSSRTGSYFGQPAVNGPLTASLGSYKYSASPAFPSSAAGNNYWVDAVFDTEYTSTANARIEKIDISKKYYTLDKRQE